MTTYGGARLPSETDDCVLPSNHPGTSLLAWRTPCTAISLSSEAPSTTLSMDEVRGVFQRSIASWTTVDCGGAPTGLAVDVLTDTNLCTSASHNRGGAQCPLRHVHRGGLGDSTQARPTRLRRDLRLAQRRHRRDLRRRHAHQQRARVPTPSAARPRVRAEVSTWRTSSRTRWVTTSASRTPSRSTSTRRCSRKRLRGERSKRTLEEDDTTAICSIIPAGSSPRRVTTPRAAGSHSIVSRTTADAQRQDCPITRAPWASLRSLEWPQFCGVRASGCARASR